MMREERQQKKSRKKADSKNPDRDIDFSKPCLRAHGYNYNYMCSSRALDDTSI